MDKLNGLEGERSDAYIQTDLALQEPLLAHAAMQAFTTCLQVIIVLVSVTKYCMSTSFYRTSNASCFAQNTEDVEDDFQPASEASFLQAHQAAQPALQERSVALLVSLSIQF